MNQAGGTMEEPAKLESFLHWGSAIGISDSPIPEAPSDSCLGRSLSVSHFPEAGGRGLAAARALRKGELVLRVPKAALMTTNGLIGSDQMLSAALGKHPFLSSTQIFCIALLNEVNKDRSSWWYPYLNQLPRSYDLLESFGLFEIEALQIDDAIWAAEKAVVKGKTEWEEATPLMCELSLKPRLRSLKAWLWASATISSRTMHIPWDTTGCLCPVGDYFNYTPPEEQSSHSNSRKIPGADFFSSVEVESMHNPIDGLSDMNTDRLIDAGYDEATACYCFYAKRDYGKGEQVLLSYGTYTNLELLEHYGFILQENPNDKAFIPLETEMYALCPWPSGLLYIAHDGKPSYALFSTIRLWATPPNNRRSTKHLAFSGQRVSNGNEATVLKWIMNKCQALLNRCPTTIQEDAQLLKTIGNIQDQTRQVEGLPVISFDEIRVFLENRTRWSASRWKLAVGWRQVYKKILSECVSYCSKALDDLC